MSEQMKLSFVTASYVGEPLGYPGRIDWELAAAVIEEQSLLETLGDLMRRLAPAKLNGIELWMPHSSPRRTTPALAAKLRQLVSLHGMTCCAYAGGIPDPAVDEQGAEAVFQTAMLLRAPLIAAHSKPEAMVRLVAFCKRYGMRVAFENGHETLEELRVAISGTDSDWIGINLDTGNLAAQASDPVQAVRELRGRILHLHFKDVAAVGSHDCVALGRGIVDVKGVVSELKAIAYKGWISIEIETADRDPTDEIIASAEMLRRLW